MSRDDSAFRSAVVAAMRSMHEQGLNRGTAGNASIRDGNALFVSPSGVEVEALSEEDIAIIDLDQGQVRQGPKPSSEWRLHMEIVIRRADVNAVVHCHSRFATVLSCMQQPIAPFHYLVGLSGAAEVPLAPYARFGSAELAANAATALANADACLLANHGMVACGQSMKEALALCEEMEEQAAIAWHVLAAGGKDTLTPEQMSEVLDALDEYRSPNS